MRILDEPHPGENLAGDPIDLGEVRWDEDEVGPPWRPRAWLRRGCKALAVVLLTLLAPHASAVRLAAGLGEPLWSATVLWDGLAVGPGVVYLPEGSTGATIVARDAWTGREVWRRERDRGPLYAVDLGAGIVGVRSPMGTTIVSARTGEVLYDVPGSESAYTQGVTSSDHLLLVEHVEPGTPGCPLDAAMPFTGCAEVRALSIAGGAEAWRVVTSPGEVLVASVGNGRVAGLATIKPDGFARLYDVRTGAVAATLHVEPNVTSGVLTADQIVVMEFRGDDSVVTAYARASGTRSWQSVLPGPPQTESAGWIYLYDCGDLLCASTGRGTSLIDPATGRITLDLHDQVMTSVDNGFVLAFGESAGRAPNQDVTLWDAPNGTVIAELPDASAVPWTDSGGRGLLARQGSEGTSFILVERSGQARVLGTVPQRGLSCEARGAALVCRTLGLLRVWRLPV